jgi:endoplasmic reticulum lectin 1
LNSQDIQPESENIVVTSQGQEKYQCHLPKLAKKDDLEDPSTLETSALDYLEPLFTGDVCSYRIESYWTYEICHGNYIKQYHEERDGKNTKMQVKVWQELTD